LRILACSLRALPPGRSPMFPQSGTPDVAGILLATLERTGAIRSDLAAVTAGHVNHERRCFSAAFRPGSAGLGGQIAQQADKRSGRRPARPCSSPSRWTGTCRCRGPCRSG
jgi:hypothetical protein